MEHVILFLVYWVKRMSKCGLFGLYVALTSRDTLHQTPWNYFWQNKSNCNISENGAPLPSAFRFPAPSIIIYHRITSSKNFTTGPTGATLILEYGMNLYICNPKNKIKKHTFFYDSWLGSKMAAISAAQLASISRPSLQPSSSSTSPTGLSYLFALPSDLCEPFSIPRWHQPLKKLTKETKILSLSVNYHVSVHVLLRWVPCNCIVFGYICHWICA